MNQELKAPGSVHVHAISKGGKGLNWTESRDSVSRTCWQLISCRARRRKRQPLVLLMRLCLVNRVPGNELGVWR